MLSIQRYDFKADLRVACNRDLTTLVVQVEESVPCVSVRGQSSRSLAENVAKMIGATHSEGFYSSLVSGKRGRERRTTGQTDRVIDRESGIYDF